MNQSEVKRFDLVRRFGRVFQNCRVAERIVGTKDVAEPSSGTITGASPFEMRKSPTNPYVQEHTDLINAIRTGKPLNEGGRLIGPPSSQPPSHQGLER